jgi:hypothetical protein
VGLGARAESELAGFLDAGFALVAGGVAAALADDLAGLPAAGEVVGGGSGADAFAGVVGGEFVEVAEELGVSVAGVDLDQSLLAGDVVCGVELVLEARTGWCVDSPGESVGDDEGGEAPLRELFEELGGGRGVLAAVER